MREGQQLGLQLKGEALDMMAPRPWCVLARAAAKELLQGRIYPITIDDVYEVVGPPPSPNMAGSVFRKGFRPVGRVVSNKPEGHGNMLRQWELA